MPLGWGFGVVPFLPQPRNRPFCRVVIWFNWGGRLFKIISEELFQSLAWDWHQQGVGMTTPALSCHGHCLFIHVGSISHVTYCDSRPCCYCYSHITRTTTWEDPRKTIAAQVASQQQRSAELLNTPHPATSPQPQGRFTTHHLQSREMRCNLLYKACILIKHSATIGNVSRKTIVEKLNLPNYQLIIKIIMLRVLQTITREMRNITSRVCCRQL